MLVNALEGYMSVEDHMGRDHSSHLVKHAREHCHLPVETANLEKNWEWISQKCTS